MGYKALDAPNTGGAKVPLFCLPSVASQQLPGARGKYSPKPLLSLRFESMENNEVDRFYSVLSIANTRRTKQSTQSRRRTDAAGNSR